MTDVSKTQQAPASSHAKLEKWAITKLSVVSEKCLAKEAERNHPHCIAEPGQESNQYLYFFLLGGPNSILDFVWCPFMLVRVRPIKKGSANLYLSKSITVPIAVVH